MSLVGRGLALPRRGNLVAFGLGLAGLFTPGAPPSIPHQYLLDTLNIRYVTDTENSQILYDTITQQKVVDRYNVTKLVWKIDKTTQVEIPTTKLMDYIPGTKLLDTLPTAVVLDKNSIFSNSTIPVTIVIDIVNQTKVGI